MMIKMPEWLPGAQQQHIPRPSTSKDNTLAVNFKKDDNMLSSFSDITFGSKTGRSQEQSDIQISTQKVVKIAWLKKQTRRTK